MTAAAIITGILILMLWTWKKLKVASRGWQDERGYHTVTNGVRCVHCGTMIHAGHEPFHQSTCRNCRQTL